MSIGENIKSRRKALNMQQVDLAKAVGVSQAMVCQIERGTKVPSMPLGAEIAACLGCRIDDLFEGKIARMYKEGGKEVAETLEIRTEKNAAEILLDGHPISDVLSYERHSNFPVPGQQYFINRFLQ